MLGLDQANIGPHFRTWLRDQQLRKDYPNFRDFLNNKFDI